MIAYKEKTIKTTKNSNKCIDISISVIRAISLIMIVSCHIFQYKGIEVAYWLNVGVQIFFFMSGFLYGKKDIKDNIKFYKDKINKILVPYILLVIIILIVEKIFLENTYNWKFAFANIFGFQAFVGTIDVLSHTWFVTYIMLCYLITPILQNIFKNERSITKILIIAIVGIQLLYYYRAININAPWIINYILGYVYSRYYIKDAKREKRFSRIVIGTALIILPFRIVLQYNLINMEFFKGILVNKNLIIDYSHVLLGCSLFIILYKVLNKLKLKKYNLLLRLSDKYSYFIYLVHQIFILKKFSLMGLTCSLPLNIAIIVIVSIISAVSLYYINKLFWYICGNIKEICKEYL